MTDEHALLAAIRAHPGEDTPRLVYADWLQEHDRAEEAEFLRLGVRLEAAPPDHPDYPEWLQRHDELTIWLAGHVTGPSPKFAAGLEISGKEGWWRLTRRGFPRHLEFDGDHHEGRRAIRALAALEKAFDVVPTRWLVVRFITLDQLAELVKQPVLSRLDGLTVQMRTSGEPIDEAARLIAGSPHLRNIRGLVTAFDVGEAGAAALAASENFGKLERFAPDATYLSGAAVRVLGSAPWFRNLRELSLDRELPEAGFVELCGLGPFPRLHTLDLSGNNFPVGAWEQFSQSKAFPAVAKLELHHAPLSGERAAAVFGAPWLRPAFLDLYACGIGNGGAAHLATSHLAGSLRWLALGANNLTPTGVKAVTGCRALANLRHLDVWGNAPGAIGLRALAANPALRGLTSLLLGGRADDNRGLDPSEFEAFLSKLDLPHLRRLSLDGRQIGVKAARLLLGEKFRTLTRLELRACGLTDAFVPELLTAPTLQNLVELRLPQNHLKTGVKALLDRRVMPRLGACYVDENSIDDALREKLSRRPGMVW